MQSTPLPHEQVSAYLESSPPNAVSWGGDIGVLRRETREQALAARGQLEPMAAIETVDAGGVPARLYRSRGDEREVLVWIHGGGWTHGDLDCYEGVGRALANRAECAVLAIDYRLAPEHPFPAGFEDAWAATEWARRAFSGVAVGGDSSGGNLAAAVALKARDSDLGLALQLLVYPVLDSAEDSQFKRNFRNRYSNFAGQAEYGAISYHRIRRIWEMYLPESSMQASPFASPLRAATLGGLTPVVLFTAEHDILRGEAEDYARRLRAEEVPVEVHNYAGQIHGFFQMLGLMADAQDAISVAGAALREAFVQHKRRI
jgi:acetyl esterase